MQTAIEVGVDCKWLLKSESKKEKTKTIKDFAGVVIIFLATAILLFCLP